MHLYSPRCRPDGEVVVVSCHTLKRSLRSLLVRVCFVSWCSRRQCFSTVCVGVSLVSWLRSQVPSKIESASGESAAQLSSRSHPIVKGVPAHWLKCIWFLFNMASSMVLRSYSVLVVPLLAVC